MTGTLWSSGGGESIGNRVNWPALNVRRQISIWSGFLDADDNMVLDYHPSGGQWPNIVASINAKYGITADYPDMIGPDLEGKWTEIKRAGPSHPEWDSMSSELARAVMDTRHTYSKADHIKSYNLPYANTFWRNHLEEWIENQRRLIAEVQPGLTCLQTTLYLSRSKPTWFTPYYRPALEDCIQLGVEFDLTPVAQIAYRYSPNGGVPETFTLVPEDEFRQFVREVIRDAEWQGHKCVDIGVWDQTGWERLVSLRTNTDGTFADTSPKRTQIRNVLTTEFDNAGVDIKDVVGVLEYMDRIANERYLWINEEMGFEMAGPPPVVVPLSSVEAIEGSAKDLKVIVDAAHASTADAVAAAAAHVTLVESVTP